MVGDPKSLYDLERIEAGVQATCRECGHVRLLNREKLIGDLMRRRRPLSWETLPTQMRCACGSKRVHLIPMPFSDRKTPIAKLVETLVVAADRLVTALATRGSATSELTEMAAARQAFEDAKRALLAWRAGSE